MARKPRKTPANGAGTGSSKGKKVASVGLGALLVAGLTWLTGGFTRENGVEWLKTLLIAGSVALFIRWSVGEPFKIPSNSMYPTLKGDARFMRGDRVFVNKWRFGLRYPFTKTRIWEGEKPKRWDIVVFKAAEDGAKHSTLVKRVVGLPGERIQIKDGHVYADGNMLDIPDFMPDVKYTNSGGLFHNPESFFDVPEGTYLMLGDNSAHSRDSRFWGPVPNGNMLGPVTCIWWPPKSWRDFTGFSRTWWWRLIVAVVGLFVIARLFFARSWHVRTDSLRETLAQGEHAYVSRWPFGFPVPFTSRRFTSGRDPRRGELVLYHAPSDNGEAQTLLGIVAGLPGEQVFLDEGRLTIDGEPLAQPASLAARGFDSTDGTGSYGRSKSRDRSLVPEGHYFVLVDNTDEAPDSRILGWVAKKSIIGTVSAVWWPVKSWRRIRL